MRVKTNSMGTVMIEWEDVISVATNKIYQLERQNGDRLLGSIRSVDSGDALDLITAAGTERIPINSIVTMERIKRDKDSLWERIDGSISFGLNYQKGSDIGQSNFGLTANYKEAKYDLSTSLSGTITRGSSEVDTRRFNWNNNYRRKLGNRRFWGLNADLDKNDELGIDARLLFGGSYGRYLIKNSYSSWAASVGLATSRELRLEERDEGQVEGQLSTDYSLYFFSPTKADLNVRLTIYPSFTTSDRVRGNFETRLRWELISDVYWDLNYFYTWDTKPPAGFADVDTGITTSLGYSF